MSGLNMLFGTVIVLGVLILVHEWGHFVLARLFRVRVDVFSIGFGPRLFGWKRGATDYRVSALPLGGYVRMAGQDLSDIDSGKQAPTGAPDELMSKPRWQRAIICLGGPVVNLLLPLPLLLMYFLVFGEPYPAYIDRPVQVMGQPSASSAAPASLQVGDKIVSVGGVSHPTWEKLLQILDQTPLGERLEMQVENGGLIRNVSVSLAEKGPQQVARVFGEPPRMAVVERVTSKGPAEKAGIRRGDKILVLNGRAVFSNQEFVDVVRSSNGQKIALRLARKDQQIDMEVTPWLGVSERGEKVWQIGVLVAPELAYRRVGLLAGSRDALGSAVLGTQQVIGILGKLVTGRISLRQLQGVVGIARESGEAVTRGPSSVLELMATLSLNLGILNLLPIPILDGGQILLLGIEGLRRRDLSLAFKERFIQFGLVFLLVLLVFVMYNDIGRIWLGR
jgi:regulator of sigma E protease